MRITRWLVLLILATPIALPAEPGPAIFADGVYRGMVTGTTGSIAIEAGVDMLKAGGSAADAAMATSLAQVCFAAGSWVSYAGIMTMVYFDAASGKTYNMNAAYNTVKAETDAASMPGFEFELVKSTGTTFYPPSGRSALVPGFMAGVEASHRKFGKLPFAEIFEPAIHCAENGFAWTNGLAKMHSLRKEALARLPETKAVFTKADGSEYKAGELFRQPALANTLHHVAKEGARYMYSGPWAKQLIAALQRDGGRMTLEDLRNYKVIWAKPLHTTYHGYDVYEHGLPANGGVNVIEAMNLAEVAEVSKLGRYSQSPRAMFTLAQITKAAMLTYRPEASQALGFDLSLEARTKKETAVTLWGAMQAGPAMELLEQRSPSLPAHSDAVVAVDRWGNIAALCHTINTNYWGGTGINVGGVSIPDSAAFQRDAVAEVAPGSRFPDPTNPGLIVLNGKPFMGFSAVGAGLHARTVSALINVLDFGMTPRQANDEPSFGNFMFGLPEGGVPPLSVEKDDFRPDFMAEIARLGQPMAERHIMQGFWVGIQIDPKTAELRGAAPRALKLGGIAVGY